MKIVFFGTPEYVLPVLEGLHKNFNKPNQERNLIAVVTQPPKEVGRNKFVERSAVDNWAYKHKIPVIYDLAEIPDCDLGILAAYGKIIPNEIIKAFPYGILNIHPSLLPELRGASPIQSALLLDKHETGISVIKMDEAMDHGPIVTQSKEPIFPDDTHETLRTRLFEKATPILLDLINPYLSGRIKLKQQNHDQATFTRTLAKQDGFIPPSVLQKLLNGEPCEEEMELGFIKGFKIVPNIEFLLRLQKAVTPWPGLWTNIEINKKIQRLKILKLSSNEDKLVLEEVQLEGKTEVTWQQFKEGYPNTNFA